MYICIAADWKMPQTEPSGIHARQREHVASRFAESSDELCFAMLPILHLKCRNGHMLSCREHGGSHGYPTTLHGFCGIYKKVHIHIAINSSNLITLETSSVANVKGLNVLGQIFFVWSGIKKNWAPNYQFEYLMSIQCCGFTISLSYPESFKKINYI